MNFIVRHAVPGRVRLYIPALEGRSPSVDEALAALAATPWIFSVRANYACRSVVIEYDDDHGGQFDRLLNWIASVSMAEAFAILTQFGEESKGVTKQVSNVATTLRCKWPLLVPSITFLMSLFAAPLARVLTIPLLLYSAKPTFIRAHDIWQTERRLNVDFLDTLAIGASVAQGALTAGAVITWLIALGDWVRDMTAAGSKRAVTDLLEYQTRAAWIVLNGEIIAIPAANLAVGDTVVVYPGEMIAVDGEISHGSGLIDQKTITGEGLPVSRHVGDAVFAASILQLGQLHIKAVRAGADTTAGQIARLIDAAPAGDTRMQNHAERFADRLVLPTLALAISTALISQDFGRFLSLVIIDLGTGIRVAAPTAILSSITHAARAGIIIKSGAHMEKLAEVDTIIFDKTGTLSQGTPHVVETRSFSTRYSPERILALAVAAETHLQHPVAAALREKATELKLTIPHCEESEYRVGLGVQGYVSSNYLQVGSERFMRENNIPVDHVADQRAQIDQMGCSCLHVAIDRELAGFVAYEDRIRPESAEVISALHEMGIKETVMLTGDNAIVAEAVAGRLGLTFNFADLLPADKARIVQEMQKSGRKVAMVGDGINDSPALSFADVGVAMKHGADITHESADVVLMEDSLWKLVHAIQISRDALHIVRQNYGIVAGMNAVALALALPGGLVGPEVTALISNGSAIVAGLNGLRPLARQS